MYTKTLPNRNLIQIGLNLNQPADRFLHDALATSPLGAISIAKQAKHILVEWAQQHCSHLNMSDYTEPATERKECKRTPRQPKKSAAATLISVAPATSVSGTVSRVVSEPTFTPALEQVIESKPTPVSTPDFIQKSASENLIQSSVSEISSDAILAILKQKNNPETMLEVGKKLQEIG